jgi:hypothetical protein
MSVGGTTDQKQTRLAISNNFVMEVKPIRNKAIQLSNSQIEYFNTFN